jgi:hypothetical protein
MTTAVETDRLYRRGRRALGARIRKWLAIAALAVVLAWYGLAPLGFGAWRNPIEGNPGDLGIAFENVTFQPRDQPLMLRGWSMQPAGAKAALVMVHGGGNNRSQLRRPVDHPDA